MADSTILIVDHDPAIRATRSALLRAEGYRVRIAASVSDVLRQIAQGTFDVLLSDLNMGEPLMATR